MTSKTSGQVHIKGYLDVPPAEHDAVMAAWPIHVDLSRLEPGCIKFEFSMDESVAGRIQLAEIYENEAAFEAHKSRAAQSAWAKIGKNVIRTLDIKVVD